MKYVLGIDQGGTKTSVALCDLKGHILAVSESYGSCHSVYGMEHAMGAINIAISMIKEVVPFLTREVEFVACGMTGADFDFEYGLLQENVARSIGIHKSKVIIENDSLIALRGGTDKDFGGVICAGTGLNCAFINKEGDKYVSGYYIEDAFQGATALGLKAITGVFDAESGVGKKTVLTQKILDYYGIKKVNDLLVAFVLEKEIKESMKKLTPILLQSAAEEDQVSLNILEEFANKWAEYVMAGMHKLNMKYPIDLVFSGGVFKNEQKLISRFMMKKLQKKHDYITCVHARYEPVVGAIKIGLDHVSTLKDCLREENVNQSAKKMDLLRK